MKVLTDREKLAIAELRKFAAVNGRYWKRELRHIWETCGYDAATLGKARSEVLQQIRNQFGPSWLMRVSIG